MWEKFCNIIDLGCLDTLNNHKRKEYTLMTLSYVALSRTITSVGVMVITVACLGAFCIKANSPKESPAVSSAKGT